MTAMTADAAFFPISSLLWASRWADLTGWAVHTDASADHGETVFLTAPGGDRHLPDCWAVVRPDGVLMERQTPDLGGFTAVTTSLGIFRTLEAGLMAVCLLTPEEVARATEAVEGAATATI